MRIALIVLMLLGLQPVGDPGGEDPHPPDCQEEDQHAKGAEGGEVAEQRVRELRHGEDEHEVEEQLDVGDLGVLVAVAEQVAIRLHEGCI